MFVDAETIPAGTRLEYDLCVIGCGAAGLALGRSLMRRLSGTRRVAILESGQIEPNAQAQALNHGSSTGLTYFSLVAARLRQFGGTTNKWGGVAHPFQERDFEAREWIPDSGWPIGKPDIEAYYAEAAELVGVEAPENLEAGIDRPAESEFGTRFLPRTLQRIPRAKRGLAPRSEDEFRRSEVVDVLLGATALELSADDDVRRVTSARVASLGGNAFTVNARAFVLAAGGIENPRLLLASNGQRPAGLGNEHDLVGRYFLEHPRFVAGVLHPTDAWLPVEHYRWHRNRGASYRDYLDLAPELKQREELLDVQVRLHPVFAGQLASVTFAGPIESARRLVKALQQGRIADNFAKHVQSVASDLTRWQERALPGAPLPVPDPELLRTLMGASAQETSALVHATLGDLVGLGLVKTGFAPLEKVELTAIVQPTPNPDSRVTLGEDRDALGMPRPVLDWRLTEDDRRSVRRTIELLGASAGEAGIGRVEVLHGTDDSEWPGVLRGGWHHMGTTRMHDDPRRGVVDRNCRVHGLSNLYIAGSSVYPTAGSGSPTLTLITLALRLADHLREEVFA